MKSITHIAMDSIAMEYTERIHMVVNFVSSIRGVENKQHHLSNPYIQTTHWIPYQQGAEGYQRVIALACEV